jgi:hypothetical protein
VPPDQGVADGDGLDALDVLADGVGEELAVVGLDDVLDVVADGVGVLVVVDELGVGELEDGGGVVGVGVLEDGGVDGVGVGEVDGVGVGEVDGVGVAEVDGVGVAEVDGLGELLGVGVGDVEGLDFGDVDGVGVDVDGEVDGRVAGAGVGEVEPDADGESGLTAGGLPPPVADVPPVDGAGTTGSFPTGTALPVA